MPPESGGICGRLIKDLPLGYLHCGYTSAEHSDWYGLASSLVGVVLCENERLLSSRELCDQRCGSLSGCDAVRPDTHVSSPPSCLNRASSFLRELLYSGSLRMPPRNFHAWKSLNSRRDTSSAWLTRGAAMLGQHPGVPEPC